VSPSTYSGPSSTTHHHDCSECSFQRELVADVTLKDPPAESSRPDPLDASSDGTRSDLESLEHLDSSFTTLTIIIFGRCSSRPKHSVHSLVALDASSSDSSTKRIAVGAGDPRLVLLSPAFAITLTSHPSSHSSLVVPSSNESRSHISLCYRLA
jgi:hypothetical protein